MKRKKPLLKIRGDLASYANWFMRFEKFKEFMEFGEFGEFLWIQFKKNPEGSRGEFLGR